MGFRNPFRIGLDEQNNKILVADYGPDSGSTSATRGPNGRVEWNILDQPGNYGWPYCVGNNTPYNDYNFASSTAGADLQLRRAGQRLAQQHGPDQPAAREAGRHLAEQQRRRPRAPRRSGPAVRR